MDFRAGRVSKKSNSFRFGLRKERGARGSQTDMKEAGKSDTE